RARLEDRPQTRTWIARAQGSNRLLNRRGMVREIIDDRYAINLRSHLQPAFHALEGLQRLCNSIFRNATPCRQCRRGGRVPNVVFTRKRKFELRPRLSILGHGPARFVFLQLEFGDSPLSLWSRPISLDRA